MYLAEMSWKLTEKYKVSDTFLDLTRPTAPLSLLPAPGPYLPCPARAAGFCPCPDFYISAFFSWRMTCFEASSRRYFFKGEAFLTSSRNLFLLLVIVSLGRRRAQPTQYSHLENSRTEEADGLHSWGQKEQSTTEYMHNCGLWPNF